MFVDLCFLMHVGFFIAIKFIVAIVHTHTRPFNGLLSGTTRVRRYQKGKIDLDFY